MNKSRKKRKPSKAEVRSKERLEKLIKNLIRYNRKDLFYFFIFRLPLNCDIWIEKSLADFEFILFSRAENDPVKWLDGVEIEDEGPRYGEVDIKEVEDDREYKYHGYLNIERKLAKARTYLERYRIGRLEIYRNQSPVYRQRSYVCKPVILQEQHFWELVRQTAVDNHENESLNGKHPWSFWGKAPLPEQKPANKQK